MPLDIRQKVPGYNPEDFDTDEAGVEPITINMGPSHPATHGTIRIQLRVSGEKVMYADVEIGFLHRAFEKTSETKAWNQVIPYTDRLNYCSPAINNVGYAMAVERLLDISVPPRGQYVRIIACEAWRICDHLTCLGASIMELGIITGFLYFMKAREYLYQLMDELTGARLTVSFTRVGGIVKDLPSDFAERFTFCQRQVEIALKEVEGIVKHNRIFIDRMRGVGALPAQRLVEYGVTGPLLRAAGVSYDVRKAFPYSFYDRIPFEVPTGTTGDNWDRFFVRVEEMRQSLRICREALRQIPEGPVNVEDRRVMLPDKKEVYENIESLMNHFKLIMPGHGIRPDMGEDYFAVEGANGELGFWVVSDGNDRPYRVHCRAPCLPPMAALEEMIVGAQVADVIPTFGMINMIAGELER